MEALSIPLLAATRLAHTTWTHAWLAAHELADAVDDLRWRITLRRIERRRSRQETA